MVDEDTRGPRPRKNKVMLLDNVILVGVGQVYFPSTDFKCPDPERVYVTLPKSIQNVQEGDVVEFVAEVAERDVENCTEYGNTFHSRDTVLLRPRKARIV